MKMEPTVDFKALPQRLRSMAKCVTVAVACPADAHTEEVIERSISEEFAKFILVAVEQNAAVAERLHAKYPDRTAIILATDVDDTSHSLHSLPLKASRPLPAALQPTIPSMYTSSWLPTTTMPQGLP